MLHFTGIIIAVCTFLIIGLFHPIVIKVEYHYGTRPWWIFLVLGIASTVRTEKESGKRMVPQKSKKERRI